MKRGASAEDVAFWVEQRGLKTGMSNCRKRIYAPGLEEEKVYELSDSET